MISFASSVFPIFHFPDSLCPPHSRHIYNFILIIIIICYLYDYLCYYFFYYFHRAAGLKHNNGKAHKNQKQKKNGIYLIRNTENDE